MWIFGHTQRHQGCAEKRICEDTEKRQPSISKEQRPQKKPNLPTLDLGLKASRMKRKQLLTFSVGVILLWQP